MTYMIRLVNGRGPDKSNAHSFAERDKMGVIRREAKALGVGGGK